MYGLQGKRSNTLRVKDLHGKLKVRFLKIDTNYLNIVHNILELSSSKDLNRSIKPFWM